MINELTLRIFRLLGLFIVLFGLLGVVFNVFTYNMIKPELSRVSNSIDEVQGEMDEKMVDACVFLSDLGELMYDFSEKGNFSDTWWDPFPDVNETIRGLGDSVIDFEGELEQSKNGIARMGDEAQAKFIYVRLFFTFFFMYSTALHLVIFLVGVSLIFIEGVIINSIEDFEALAPTKPSIEKTVEEIQEGVA